MSSQNIKIGNLISQAFTLARSKISELPPEWIRISFYLGARLPNSLLTPAIQRDGELDVVLRCIEAEMAESIKNKASDDIFVGHYLNALSIYWVGGMYETFRLLLDKRRVAATDPAVIGIHHDLELIRIPLEKHEIAKDQNIKEPLALMRLPLNNNATDAFSYDPDDNLRSHIMPTGLSARGSMVWQAIDGRNNRQKSIERRDISDRILALGKDDHPA
jgi:hypothetical protein